MEKAISIMKMKSNIMLRVAALFLINLMVFAFSAYAQNEKKSVRKGNKDFKKGEYLDSEIAYRTAMEINPSSFKANFNLGDALYKQDKWEDAAGTFEGLSNAQISDLDKSKVFYNLGNSYFKNEKFQESIDAYKQSLRLNPNDLETKYNLSQAQRLLQQQQDNQDQQQDKDNQQDNQDDKDDQQKQDKKDDEQKQDDQQNKDQQNQPEKDKQQQEQNKQQISPEDAQRMLEAIQSREKDIQEKVKEEQAKQAKVKVEKNW